MGVICARHHLTVRRKLLGRTTPIFRKDFSFRRRRFAGNGQARHLERNLSLPTPAPKFGSTRLMALSLIKAGAAQADSLLGWGGCIGLGRFHIRQCGWQRWAKWPVSERPTSARNPTISARPLAKWPRRCKPAIETRLSTLRIPKDPRDVSPTASGASAEGVANISRPLGPIPLFVGPEAGERHVDRRDQGGRSHFAAGSDDGAVRNAFGERNGALSAQGTAPLRAGSVWPVSFGYTANGKSAENDRDCLTAFASGTMRDLRWPWLGTRVSVYNQFVQPHCAC